jgi:predicted nucleic acid-binding protein
MATFVLDSSTALSWCFEDEKMASTTALYDAIDNLSTIFVPSLWLLEITNTFALSLKRNRVTEDDVSRYLYALSNLLMSIDPLEDRRTFTSILPLARKHDLTTYDATYLDLARRKKLPLATLDKALQRAAAAEGIEVLS